MIIQELLKTCNCRNVAKIWVNREVCKETDIDKLTMIIEEFCGMLCSLIPNSSDDVLVANKSWRHGEEIISGLLYKKVDFEKALVNVDKISMPDPDELTDKDTEENYKKISDRMRELDLQNYGYEFTLWEDILGAEVIMESIEGYGLTEILSDVLYELSFNGMTREKQKKRRDELEKVIEESLNEDSKDEWCKLNIDELWEEWGLEKTTEEQNEESRMMAYDIAKTAAEECKKLKEIAKMRS